MKRKVRPDEVLFVLAAIMGVTVISAYASIALINLVAYLIF